MAAHPSEGNKLLRAVEMTLVQMFISQEAVYECVKELGELGEVQFVDLLRGTSLFQRCFVSELKRAEEMERKLRYLVADINKEDIRVSLDYTFPRAPTTLEICDLEVKLDGLHVELTEVNKNLDDLVKSYTELLEIKNTLVSADVFFAKGTGSIWSGNTPVRTPSPFDTESGEYPRHLSYITGILDQDKVSTFERILWRSSRGNVFVRVLHLSDKDPIGMYTQDGNYTPKSSFICMFQGDQLRSRVTKICNGLGARIYPCKEKLSERRAIRDHVTIRLDEMADVIGQTQEYRLSCLRRMSGDIRDWIVQVKKWRAIYYTMSKFNVNDTNTGYITEGWVQVEKLNDVQVALNKGAVSSGSRVMPIMNRVHTTASPPTHHRTNKLIRGYQALIDAYGVATYQEINPAIFTIVTFPFLFGIMFGDMGHGAFLFLFGLYMIYKEGYFDKRRAILGEIFLMLYMGRYIIMMMGIFSSYAGFLYNDIYSKGFDIFGTSWTLPKNDTKNYSSSDYVTLDPKYDYTQPYFYGIDPYWIIAENELTFMNSYKMKLSVVLGLCQMTFGLCLSCINYRYFGQYLDIFLTFVPQMIFLQCIIGYMVFLIFWKWFFMDVGGTMPSILTTMIDMFLDFGEKISDSDRFFKYQEQIQDSLVIIAVCMIPIMLVGKPLVQKYIDKREVITYEEMQDVEMTEDAIREEENAYREAEIDLWVNQGIHTIEFCLGVISNTASYLRLWALSLAHSELSYVIWDMTIYYAFYLLTWNNGGFALLFVLWLLWAVLTLAILLCMEGLSAFLHALRLHWVEFQNKFYSGNGQPFLPFSFNLILENEENLEPIENI